MIAFDGNILKPVWDAAALGPNSTVGLIHRNGRLVARHPEPDGPVDMSKYVLFTDYMRKKTSGTYTASSPVDKRERLVAYKIIERTPFVAIASADMGVVMRPFWNDAKIAALLLSLATGAVLVATSRIRSLNRLEAAHVNALTSALQTNKELMREIHHRVKNNLQTVMSLLRLQGFEAKAVNDLSERIAAMSSVHEQMYGFDEFTFVRAKEFIPGFVRKIVGFHPQPITVSFTIDDISIGADEATPFALLVNELIVNSMKYAFPGRETGHISVELTRSSDKCILVVADNGIGIEGSTKSGMGTSLIKAFVKQLQGSFHYTYAGGARFEAVLNLEGK
ncbi:histidine kinase dimerization/phosphoacceptor domain -containing protein [Rhizobium cauense]|uniref:histidine kinase dimerization/phosphoacceptor domain -containing protein n=1 Tax=Rhizobium cauense TaxID=1166683 RepID=UPI003B82FE8E